MWPTVYGEHVRIVRESDYRKLLRVARAADRVVKARNESGRAIAMCHLSNMLAALNKRSTKP